MEKVLQVLNRMQADGVIEKFAIGGGIATIRYLQAYFTDDIDIFISPVVVAPNGLVTFCKIYSYLADLGYNTEREYIRIEEWLVQFVPASESVQQEAVERAERVMFGGTPTLIFSIEHLAAELLRSGRMKDHVRVVALIESEQMDMDILRGIISRHRLIEKWDAFSARFSWRNRE